MRKVLFVPSDNSIASGAFKSMAKLCELLRDEYGVVPVVALRCNGTGEKLLDDMGIAHIRLRSHHWIVPMGYKWSLKARMKQLVQRLDNWLSAVQLSQYIRQQRIELVHINTSYSYVGAIAALKAKVPFVWHLRELLEEDQHNQFWNRDCIRLINRANYVIAISEAVYQKYSGKLENLVMIPNGVDPFGFYYPGRAILSNDCVELLCVGNMNGTKGQEIVLAACAELWKRGHGNWHLSLVGGGTQEEAYRRQCDELGLSNLVTFYGVQENVGTFYQKADIMIMSSRAEAFGRTTIEAMFAGCAVVGAASGATPALLGNGVYGCLYQSDDAIALADCLEQILNAPEEVRRKAAEGQAYAMSQFTAQMNARRVYELYHELFDGEKRQEVEQ